MNPRNAEDIFYDALDLPSGERDAFIAGACGDDAALLAEVRSLLTSHAKAGGFLEAPAIGAAADAVRDTADPNLGRQVGAFRIVRRIAAGGMGQVYLAERAAGEFTQEVAIKLIRRHLHDEDALRRFRNECQVLAMLEHPNIARMIDGGFTEDGTPFIVMEFVDGVPIDTYCAENDLGVNQRLDLFRTVCEAVQHAHRHSTIHRDIKPANILVDRTGTVKLVDFGIARVMDAAEGVDRERTETSKQMLTPLYASPEQIRGDVLSTSTDIYSLGVVLYKLLTGRAPYTVRLGSVQEMAKILEDTQPTRPSDVILQPPSEGTTGAATGPTGDSRKVSRQLKGDLDTIILMALRKEAERRYLTVDQFSEDIHRHLRGLPVIARPDTFGYRAGKFARRNAVSVAAGGVVLLVLIASTAIGFTLYQRSEVARREAVEARDDALRQRAAAEEINTFLEGLLAAVDPVQEGSRPDVTVREALELAGERVDRELAGQPSVAAALHNTIGTAYYNLGLYDPAETHLHRALEMRRALEPPDPAGEMMSLVSLGQLRWKMGEFPAAEQRLREALAIGESNPSVDPAVMTECEFTLSRILSDQSKLDEAEAFARRAAETAKDVPDPRSRLRAQTINEVGVVLYNQGSYEAAEAVLAEAVAVARETLGNGHVLTGECLNNYGTVIDVSGRHAEAIPVYEEALAIYAVAYPPDHPEYTMTRMNLADALQFTGQYDQAIAMYQDVRTKFTAVYGPDHINVGMACNNLAYAMWKQRDREGAIAIYVEALRILEPILGSDHPGIGTVKINYAKVLRETDRQEEAERVGNEVLAMMRASLPEGHHHLNRPLGLLAELHMDRGDFQGAEPLLLEVEAIAAGAIAPESVEQCNIDIMWARCLTGLGRYEEALPPLMHAYAVFDSTQGIENDRTQRAMAGLVKLYTAWGKPDDAAAWQARITHPDFQ